MVLIIWRSSQIAGNDLIENKESNFAPLAWFSSSLLSGEVAEPVDGTPFQKDPFRSRWEQSGRWMSLLKLSPTEQDTPFSPAVPTDEILYETIIYPSVSSSYPVTLNSNLIVKRNCLTPWIYSRTSPSHPIDPSHSQDRGVVLSFQDRTCVRVQLNNCTDAHAKEKETMVKQQFVLRLLVLNARSLQRSVRGEIPSPENHFWFSDA